MQEKRHKILEEALKLVPFDGWTGATLTNASINAGLEPEYGNIVFPGGLTELVDFFLRDLDHKMQETLSKKDITKLRIRDRIHLAVKTRLELAEPYKTTIRKTISFYAVPLHSLESIPAVWKTADEIWYAVGDKASDFNPYTQRAILSGVYSSTLLYWLQDKSHNHQDTWAFLSRRIDNVMKFEKVKSKVRDFVTKIFPK
ncbi:MAG: rpsU-divergently transcribed protein [Rickettsiaceae bacterium]|nr:rpsU-divergently transcribed protein [Rickettsiaceae bacterium]